MAELRLIERLRAWINDPGLDSLEISQLSWLHTKITTFRKTGNVLESAETRTYEELKARFLSHGPNKHLPTFDSMSLGLSQNELETLTEIRAKVEKGTVSTADRIWEQTIVDRQLEYGIRELKSKKVILFRDVMGKNVSGFDEASLVRLAELQLKHDYGTETLLDEEMKELIDKKTILLHLFYMGGFRRRINNRAWNKRIEELQYKIWDTLIDPDASTSVGAMPSLTKQMNPKYTVEEKIISHDPNPSKTLMESPPIPKEEQPYIPDSAIPTEQDAGTWDDNVPIDEVLEPPLDYSKLIFPDNIRCRLCYCNQKEAHSPPFYRSCSFFRGQIPQKIQQRCCGGFHRTLAQGTKCPVVKTLGKREFRPVYNQPIFRPRGAGAGAGAGQTRPIYQQAQRGGSTSTPRVNQRPHYQRPHYQRPHYPPTQQFVQILNIIVQPHGMN